VIGGYGATSKGIAVVDGAASVWSNSGSLSLGPGGGTLSITDGGSVSSGDGTILFRSFVNVDGAGSIWSNRGSLSIGPAGGTLSIVGGGSVTATTVTIYNTSLLAIDVGRSSSLVTAGTIRKIDNNGTIRILAAAGVPVDNNVKYSPISAGTWSGTGAYQAVGGTWDATAHTFTASTVAPGASGSPVAINRASVQRMLIDDIGADRTGWGVGASVLAGSGSMTFTATAIDGAILGDLESLAGDRQEVLSGWTFATTGYDVSSTKPLYLSFDVGAEYPQDDLKVWHYDGSDWTKYAPMDLTYDGRYASFTASELSGYGVTAPEPGTLAMLGVGVLGVLMCVGRKRKRA
jgi:T5SS/PEP-CTERM-associated repeat protein